MIYLKQAFTNRESPGVSFPEKRCLFGKKSSLFQSEKIEPLFQKLCIKFNPEKKINKVFF
jgi:hypothetical protein